MNNISENNRKWRFFAFIATVLFFSSFSSGLLAQEKKLFSDVPNQTFKMDKRANEKLEKIKKRKTTIEIRVVTISIPLISDAKKSINLNLFREKEFLVTPDRIERREANNYSWFGKINGKKTGTAIFVVNNGNVTGKISVDGEIYSIEPIGNGNHAIIKIDPAKFPPDHPPTFEEKYDIKSPQKLNLIKFPWWKNWICKIAPQICVTTIDVIVAYTPSAMQQYADMDSLIQLAVDESNESYIDSAVKIKLNLVYKYETSYTESNSFDTDLTRFRTKNDGYMDEIHSNRDKYKADVAVLIINNSDYCGLASAIMATESNAFAVVYYDCATGYYSFAHEIGHLQGARHNPEADSTNTPYTYGHGYLYKDGGWRTIMAYNYSGCCTRIKRWSNPDKTYNNIATGTANTHNNARVLNETRLTVGGFR